ncbi:hypothetical protein JGU71_14860 [Antrihabitans sp. YC3-6]|uniref:Uncharacterized protein n=1 Tax=Antrihabitans stalagmiti TaxID=2799499 RepID=A0A934NRN0_9NOCA|nr:hypothetical protein [Antrihabitans stalagmiti]MBJ8340168.1 hypothetical protein [Antrihabitans stalagmiti]
MTDSLKERLRAKLRRQIAEDGGDAADIAEGDDPRLIVLENDLAVLDEVADDDPIIEELAAKYWVP